MTSTSNLGPPPGLPLVRHQFEAIVRDAGDALDLARRDPTRAIHAFRVALKRWRALLRVIEPSSGARARHLRHEAAGLARGLGQSRDIQAALDALADCRGAPSAPKRMPARSWQTIAGRLQSRRTGAEQASLDALAVRRLRRAFGRASGTLADWPLETVTVKAIAKAMARTFGHAQRTMPEDFTAADIAALHEFRKQVITLRYQVEMLRPLWPKFWRAYCAELQKLRAQLGQINDLGLLAGLCARQQPLAPWRAKLTPLIDERHQDLVGSAERLARRIFAGTPKAFAALIMAQGAAMAWEMARETADDIADAPSQMNVAADQDLATDQKSQ